MLDSCITSMNKDDVKNYHNKLLSLFMSALDYRSQHVLVCHSCVTCTIPYTDQIWACNITGLNNVFKPKLFIVVNNIEHDVNVLLYSGVYDIKVLLWVKTTLGWLKFCPTTVGIEPTYDLRNASPVLYRLSYVVWTVCYCDISEIFNQPSFGFHIYILI